MDWAVIWPNVITIIVTIGAFILAYVTSVRTTSEMTKSAKQTKLAELRTRWIEDTRAALADFDRAATELISRSPSSVADPVSMGRLFRMRSYIQLKLNLSEKLHSDALSKLNEIVAKADIGQPAKTEFDDLGNLFNKIFKVEWNRVLVHLGEKSSAEVDAENKKLLEGK